MVMVLTGIFFFPKRVGAKKRVYGSAPSRLPLMLPNGSVLSGTWRSASLRHCKFVTCTQQNKFLLITKLYFPTQRGTEKLIIKT